MRHFISRSFLEREREREREVKMKLHLNREGSNTDIVSMTTKQRHTSIFMVLVLLLWLASNGVESRHSHVLCDKISPIVIRECPVKYPVCCIWPNGVFAACCPANSMCDLYSAECVHMENRSTPPPRPTLPRGNATSPFGSDGSDENSGYADDDTNVVKGVMGKTDYSQPGVEMSLQLASSFVGVGFFGFLLLLSAAMQYGKVVAYRREEARRQRELEARELLVATDAAEDEEAMRQQQQPAEETNDEEEDEELLCKVCFCNKMDCALIKCGHIVCCRWCAKKLAICPICREHVAHIVVLDNVEEIRQRLKTSSSQSVISSNANNTEASSLATNERSTNTSNREEDTKDAAAKEKAGELGKEHKSEAQSHRDITENEQPAETSIVERCCSHPPVAESGDFAMPNFQPVSHTSDDEQETLSSRPQTVASSSRRGGKEHGEDEEELTDVVVARHIHGHYDEEEDKEPLLSPSRHDDGMKGGRKEV